MKVRRLVALIWCSAVVISTLLFLDNEKLIVLIVLLAGGFLVCVTIWAVIEVLNWLATLF